MLTDEQLAAFEHNGVLVVENVQWDAARRRIISGEYRGPIFRDWESGGA